MFYLRYRYSQITEEDRPFVGYAIYAEEYDYDSYNDDGKYGEEDFDYNKQFGNSTFNYSEFTKRAGFVLDKNTLIECSWRGRKCFAEVGSRN